MNRLRTVIAVVLGIAAPPLHAGHPLLTEDTGTQGAGNFQIEVSYDASRDRADAELTRAGLLVGVLTYGLADTLDLQIGYLYLRRSDGMGGAVEGGGDAIVGLKWRFFERDGFSIGLKPDMTIPSGDDEQGLGQGRKTYGAALILSNKAGDWAFHGDLGARRNANTVGERSKLYHISAAALVRVAEKVRLALDAGVIRQPDPAKSSDLAFLILGLIYSPAKNLDLDVGWRAALSDAAVDRTLGVGVTVRW